MTPERKKRVSAEELGAEQDGVKSTKKKIGILKSLLSFSKANISAM